MCAERMEPIIRFVALKAECGRRERSWVGPPARGRSPLAVNLAVKDRRYRLLPQLTGVVGSVGVALS